MSALDLGAFCFTVVHRGIFTAGGLRIAYDVAFFFSWGRRIHFFFVRAATNLKHTHLRYQASVFLASIRGGKTYDVSSRALFDCYRWRRFFLFSLVIA